MVSFSAFEQQPLRVGLRRCAVGYGFDSAPACDQFVVGAGVFGLSQTFAKCVKPVGELADSLCLAPKGGEKRAGCGFSSLLQCANEMVQCLPYRGSLVCAG